MTLPRITVVTPTFERVEFLRECIESVLAQGYPNLEYIICDGGSKNPRLHTLIREYESRLAWWDSHPDCGHAEAIRRGFSRSTGDVLAYLCSDDAYCPGALEIIGQVFAENPSVDLVYGNAIVVDENGAVQRETRSVPPTRLGIITCLNMVQPAMFWTKAIYQRVGESFGGANLEFAVFEPQVELMYRFARAGVRCRQTRRFLTRMRQHPNAVSSLHRDKATEAQRQSLQRYFPYWATPWRYRMLWTTMRMRQLAWHIAQGEAGYVLRRGRLPVALRSETPAT
jgi:glycosyltransferase involved in cell wall biosynthesis